MKKKRFIIYSLLLILLLALVVSAIAYVRIREGYLDDKLLETAGQHGTWRARLLLMAGADVNARGKDGETALMKAVDPNLVGVLLESGADIEARDNYGQTVLMKAADNTELSIVKLLLENGADINAKDNFGRTALIKAVVPSFKRLDVWLDVVEVLLESGADINATDHEGATALIYVLESICHTSRDTVDNLARFLVNHGADVNMMTKDGCRALDRAFHGELREFLLDAGAIPGEGEGCRGIICV